MKPVKPKKPINRNTWVKTRLRSASLIWPARNEAIKAARAERGKYKCAECSGLFLRSQIQVDHINPVVDPKTGWTNFDDFINRLFCDVDGLRVLCRICHDSITSVQDAMRTYYTKKRKEQK
jgi:5-methylcytosine-specific restriction endonuclease McrA